MVYLLQEKKNPLFLVFLVCLYGSLLASGNGNDVEAMSEKILGMSRVVLGETEQSF